MELSEEVLAVLPEIQVFGEDLFKLVDDEDAGRFTVVLVLRRISFIRLQIITQGDMG